MWCLLDVLTLLVSTLPGAATAMLSSCPGDGFCFRFLVEISKHLFVRIGTCQSRSIYTKHICSGVAGRSLSAESEGQWFKFRMALFLCLPISHFFVGAMYFVTNVKICTMIGVSSEQSTSQLYRVLLPLLFCVAILLLLAAAPAVLLLPRENGISCPQFSD